MSGFLVTGAGGQLARAFLGRLGREAVGLASSQLDVTDVDAIRSALDEHRPDWVVHCAAATKVDRCEREPDWARAVNAEAPARLAGECRVRGIALMHWSTDFVFDGEKDRDRPAAERRGYVEDEAIRPLSVYGSTKAEGEEAIRETGPEQHLILRTQWVCGPGGRNFPAAILQKAQDGDPLSVVEDQWGQPSLTHDLVGMSIELIRALEEGHAGPGTYHVANRGAVSWWDFARLVLDRQGFAHVPIQRIPSSQLSLPAPRPAWSVLDCSRLEQAIGMALPSVEEGFSRYLELLQG